MFKQGELVKSKLRTKEYPLFLMILFDRSPSKTQFNAVVILDVANTGDTEEEKQGYTADNWNTEQFERTTWKKANKFLNKL